MKILKYVLLLLLVVVVAGAIYVATRPNSFEVSRSKVIKAPPAVVFNNVSDFKNWEAWNPWMEKDTTIKATYPEQTSGIGGSYSWTSEESGGGKMTNLEMVANKSLTQELKFDDFDASTVTWNLEEVEDGTNVTWTMKGDNMGFMFKAIVAISGGMDNMVGDDYAKGLENLDKVITEQMKNMPQATFRLGDVTQGEVSGKQFVGYFQKTTTDAAIDEMTKLFMKFMPKAGMYGEANKLDYTPGSLYTKWNEETKEAEFYIGLLVHSTDKLPPSEGLSIMEGPEGKIVKISKFGPYGVGDMEAHAKIAEFMQQHKLMPAGPVWELYENDPMEVKPADIQTDIYYLVTDAK